MNHPSHIEHENTYYNNIDIGSLLKEGEQYYHKYIRLQRKSNQDCKNKNEKIFQKNFQKSKAMEYLLDCINSSVSQEFQYIRIHALVLIIELYKIEGNIEKIEHYFYISVGLVEHYFGEGFQKTPEWKKIIKVYLQSINPNFSKKFPKKYIPLLSTLLSVNILSGHKKRIQIQLEQVANSIQSCIYPDTHLGIIDWLEEIFGPMRISIVSKEGNESIICHRVDTEDNKIHTVNTNISHHTTVEIFDKKVNYIVTVDRGGNGKINTFSLSHLEHIIYPIINVYIQKKEYALFLDSSDHSAYIQGYEEGKNYNKNVTNYGDFIRHVLSRYTLDHSEENITGCSQSIDICRIISSQYLKGTLFSGDALVESIDGILGGVIQRNVLMLVKSHLMSRHETMNGTGYPFGLSKNKIPIESRIYTIIRAYEALLSIYQSYPKKIASMLKNWGNGGYLDSGILSIFLEYLEKNSNKENTLPSKKNSKISAYRNNFYKIHITQWRDILDQMEGIEKDYDTFRSLYTKKNEQNRIAKSMNEGVLILRCIAQIRTVFIVTRHGETESDIPGGSPGNDDEHITQQGELNSWKKGKILQGLEIQIHASPLLRSMESAGIISKEVNDCTQNSQLSNIQIQELTALRNPLKNKDSGRYNSYIQKLIQDNINGLMEFLIDTISSSNETINLCITHRDSGRHLIFWLNNLFIQEKTSGEKTTIENSSLLVYLFQGDRCISWNLGFPIFKWKEILTRVNMACIDIFGKPFYNINKGRINPIALHDAFLDFMDFHRENYPEKIADFQKKLKSNPETKDFSEIMNI